MTLTLTREIAYSASVDAANRRMRAANRKHWTRGDYDLACRTFNEIWPPERDIITPDAMYCPDCDHPMRWPQMGETVTCSACDAHYTRDSSGTHKLE